MRIAPLHNNVLVKRRPGAEISGGGIHIPETAQDRRQGIGDVVGVGPGRVLENGEKILMTVQAGHVVVYPEYAGQDFEIDGEQWLMISEDDIMAVIHDEEEDS